MVFKQKHTVLIDVEASIQRTNTGLVRVTQGEEGGGKRRRKTKTNKQTTDNNINKTQMIWETRGQNRHRRQFQGSQVKKATQVASNDTEKTIPYDHDYKSINTKVSTPPTHHHISTPPPTQMRPIFF